VTGVQTCALPISLEEVVEAELLLHVVDLSHPLASEHILSVNSVLAELGTSNKCMLMVFNKIDCTAAADLLGHYLERFPNSVGVSARTGEGIPALLAKLGSLLSSDRELVTLVIPHHEAAVIAKLHLTAQIVERDYSGSSAKFKAHIPRRLRGEFERFIEPKATVFAFMASP
jgi:GTP-binding protein HflX